jgi:hypothetical protein
MAGSTLLVADGVIGVSGKPVRIYGLHVLSGAAAGAVKLYNGTTNGGTLYVHEVCGTVSTGNEFDYGDNGILFPSGCYYEEVVDANVTSTLVSHEQEN